MTSIEPGLVRTEFAGTSHGSANDYYANLPFEPLDAEDVARTVLYAVSRPEHVSVDEVAVRPTKQPVSISASQHFGFRGRCPQRSARGVPSAGEAWPKEKDRDWRHGPS